MKALLLGDLCPTDCTNPLFEKGDTLVHTHSGYEKENCYDSFWCLHKV